MPTDSDLGQRVYSNVDGADGRVQSKDVGHGSSATLAAVAQYQVIVDSDGNKHVEFHGNKPGGTSDIVAMLSELGAGTLDGFYHGTNNSDPSNTGLVAMVRNATPADSQQTLRTTGIANADNSIRTLDVSLFDENALPYGPLNPLPVSVTDIVEGGTQIHDEKTIDDLAAGGTDGTHIYAVPSTKTFKFEQVLAGAAGDHRVEVQIGDGAVTEVFTRKAYRYGTPGKDASFTLATPILVVGTAQTTRIKVIVKNMDNKATDISTTIVGTLLA